MEDSNTLFCSSKFLWVRERISSKLWQFGHASSKSFASPGIVLLSASVSTVDLVTLKFQTNKQTNKQTPTPRHFSTPSRPARQLRWILHVPKTMHCAMHTFLTGTLCVPSTIQGFSGQLRTTESKWSCGPADLADDCEACWVKKRRYQELCCKYRHPLVIPTMWRGGMVRFNL